MDHGGGMNGMNGNTSSAMAAMQHYTHMTFFWGKNSEILFTGWPGRRGGMYALALIVVFVIAVLLEWIRHSRRLIPAAGGESGCCKQVVAAGLAQTAQYAVRVGLSYLLMLAVMSFNGGVLIIVVLGHAVGFLVFGSSVFRRPTAATCDCGKEGAMPIC